LESAFCIDDWTQQELKTFVQEYKAKHQPTKKDDLGNKFAFYEDLMSQQEQDQST
jgi:hypothetical protein